MTVVVLESTELQVTRTAREPTVMVGVVHEMLVVPVTVLPVQAVPPTETVQPVAKLVPVTVMV